VNGHILVVSGYLHYYNDSLLSWLHVCSQIITFPCMMHHTLNSLTVSVQHWELCIDGVVNFSVYGVAILVLIAKPNGLGLWCRHQQLWTVSKWYLSISTFSFTKLYFRISPPIAPTCYVHAYIASRWFFHYFSSPMQTLAALMVRRVFLPIESSFRYSSANLDFKGVTKSLDLRYDKLNSVVMVILGETHQTLHVY
jgi:hypothetical protein